MLSTNNKPYLFLFICLVFREDSCCNTYNLLPYVLIITESIHIHELICLCWMFVAASSCKTICLLLSWRGTALTTWGNISSVFLVHENQKRHCYYLWFSMFCNIWDQAFKLCSVKLLLLFFGLSVYENSPWWMVSSDRKVLSSCKEPYIKLFNCFCLFSNCIFSFIGWLPHVTFYFIDI